MDAEETDDTEPSGPHDDLIDGLQVEYAKYEDELEENEVPKVVFDVLKCTDKHLKNLSLSHSDTEGVSGYLILDGAQFAKYDVLDDFAEYQETAVAKVHQNLKNQNRI